MNRRTFLSSAGQAMVAASLAAKAQEKPIELPPTAAPTEKQPGPQPLPRPPSERVGYAVVGLGNLAMLQIIPALRQCKNAKLVAVVSGDRAKASQVAREQGLGEKNVYDYKTFDRLADNPEVQVIYIVLPNGMHAEYTIRGARAGKHILCEKPMANTPEECQQMIAACEKASTKLMIAYRMQYEPCNRFIKEMVRKQQYGPVKLIEAVNTQNQGGQQWRHQKSLAGGGALPDIGLYCLNTTRFLLGEEPVEVLGTIYSTPGDSRFKEIEETVCWQMHFPSGVRSTHISSYGCHDDSRYRVHATTGWVGIDPAFRYGGLRIERSRAEGDKEIRDNPQIEPAQQFALEVDHMAECVRQNLKPYTPGEEGLQDQRIMAAIYQSAREGRAVKLTPHPGKDIFRGTEPS